MLTNHALGVNDCGQSHQNVAYSPRFQSVTLGGLYWLENLPRRMHYLAQKPHRGAWTGHFLTRAVRPTRPAKPKRSNAAEPGSGVESNPGTVAAKLSTSTLPVGEATVM